MVTCAQTPPTLTSSNSILFPMLMVEHFWQKKLEQQVISQLINKWLARLFQATIECNRKIFPCLPEEQLVSKWEASRRKPLISINSSLAMVKVVRTLIIKIIKHLLLSIIIHKRCRLHIHKWGRICSIDLMRLVKFRESCIILKCLLVIQVEEVTVVAWMGLTQVQLLTCQEVIAMLPISSRIPVKVVVR